MWTNFVYGLGAFFQWTFHILYALKNIPNLIFLIIVVVGVVIWMMKQKKYNEAADREGVIR